MKNRFNDVTKNKLTDIMSNFKYKKRVFTILVWPKMIYLNRC